MEVDIRSRRKLMPDAHLASSLIDLSKATRTNPERAKDGASAFCVFGLIFIQLNVNYSAGAKLF